MNGNKLTNSEIKGYASRSRVGGQFAVVGKSCSTKKESKLLKNTVQPPFLFTK